MPFWIWDFQVSMGEKLKWWLVLKILPTKGRLPQNQACKLSLWWELTLWHGDFVSPIMRPWRLSQVLGVGQLPPCEQWTDREWTRWSPGPTGGNSDLQRSIGPENKVDAHWASCAESVNERSDNGLVSSVFLSAWCCFCEAEPENVVSGFRECQRVEI